MGTSQTIILIAAMFIIGLSVGKKQGKKIAPSKPLKAAFGIVFDTTKVNYTDLSKKIITYTAAGTSRSGPQIYFTYQVRSNGLNLGVTYAEGRGKINTKYVKLTHGEPLTICIYKNKKTWGFKILGLGDFKSRYSINSFIPWVIDINTSQYCVKPYHLLYLMDEI